MKIIIILLCTVATNMLKWADTLFFFFIIDGDDDDNNDYDDGEEKKKFIQILCVWQAWIAGRQAGRFIHPFIHSFIRLFFPFCYRCRVAIV